MIVFGILVALFIDSAWEYRQERIRETEHLESLRTEIRANVRELASDQAARERILARTAALLETASGPPPPALVRDSAAYWIQALLDFRFYAPSQSALEDLTSGDLGLVRSDQIRRRILGYLQERNRLAVVEERERAFVADQVEPYLRERLDLAAMISLRSLDSDEGLPPADSSLVRPLLEDPAFRSLAYLRWQQAELSHRFGESLDRRLERLLESLDEELGEDSGER